MRKTSRIRRVASAPAGAARHAELPLRDGCPAAEIPIASYGESGYKRHQIARRALRAARMPRWGAGWRPLEAVRLAVRPRGPASRRGSGPSASAGASPRATGCVCRASNFSWPASLLAGAGLAHGGHSRGIDSCRLDTAARAVSRHRPRWQTFYPLLRTDVHLHLPRGPASAGHASGAAWDRGAGQSQTGARICAPPKLGAWLVLPNPRRAAPGLHASSRDHGPLPAAGLAIS